MNISFEPTSNTLPTGLASLPVSEGSKRRGDSGVHRNRRNKRVRRGDQHSGMNMSMQDTSIQLSEFSDSPRRRHLGSPMRDESLDDFANSLREATMASYSMDFSNVSISGGGPSAGRAAGAPSGNQRLSQMVDLSARDTTMNTSIQGAAAPANFYNASFGGGIMNNSANAWGSFPAVNRANSGSGNSMFERIPRDGPDRL